MPIITPLDSSAPINEDSEKSPTSSQAPSNKSSRSLKSKSDKVLQPEIIDAVAKNLVRPISKSLTDYQAGPEDIARVIGGVMNFSDNDSAKLKAAQLAIDLHGLDEHKDSNKIVFVVNGQNVNVESIFFPRE